jgi:ArsR family transcriptional regulator
MNPRYAARAIFVKANMKATPCCASTPAPRLRDAATLATVYRALADETRLRILALLAPPGDGAADAAAEVCVCHIHESLGLPQPTVSRHLAYLRKAGLVEARRQGIWMHYRVARPANPVVRTVLEAALHALGHAERTSRDRQRLGRVLAAAEPSQLAGR